MAEAGTSAPQSPSSALFDAEVDLRFQVRQIVPEASLLELGRVQFDESYRHAANRKFHHLIIKASDLSAPGANILKQTCLTLGAEAGVHRGAINCTIDREAVLITATRAQLERLILKLRPQPFGLKKLAESISRMLQRQKQVEAQPLQTVAIFNCTPDSFSDGGRFDTLDQLLQAADEALKAGVDMLDIGGESTRPGAEALSSEEEISRVIPVIEALHSHFPQARLSIDTRKAAVAKAALSAGAHLVNDVSGLSFDPQMAPLVATTGCPVILMHSQGTPDIMQQNPTYDDVMGEISRFFYRQIGYALSKGVQLEQMILDPGIGFGKKPEHNLELLKRLPELTSIGLPLMVGTSRKSFLTMGQPIATDQREALTAASHAVAVMGGAKYLRFHHVAVQMPVIQWLKALQALPGQWNAAAEPPI